MNVALVHDWLVAQRGGEQVLLELARLFPRAPIYTLVHAPGTIHPELEAHPIHTSIVQHLPLAPRRFRHYLPLFPAAISAFDLRAFDLIVSTSHCVAKAARTREGQLHISYVHTPMRYIWDQMPHYLASLPLPLLSSPIARLMATLLRRWDVRTAQRPDVVLANSKFVGARISRLWGRQARVVYPPVDVDFFAVAPICQRRGLLAVGALVPYKRIDLAIELCHHRAIDLTIVGDGPERERLQRAAPASVRFVRSLALTELRRAYACAEALLFPAEEDFGLVPVEAMAAGCPVIAYGSGGALETVVGEGASATGVFFTEPTVDSLTAAVDRFFAARTQGAYERATLVERARVFDRRRFLERFKVVLREHDICLPTS